MKKRVDILPAPTIYCPKDKKNVPIWHCLGSFTQGRGPCPHLVKATIHGAKWAEVECKPKAAAKLKDSKQRSSENNGGQT